MPWFATVDDDKATVNFETLLGTSIERRAAAPLNPQPGKTYFNTTDATLYVWSGTGWLDLIGGAAPPTGPAGGDLGGTYPNPTVPGLAGKVDTGDSRLTDARTPTAHTHPQTDVTGLAASLALKADLASPTFSGTPSLPTGAVGITQSPGNNTTRFATTEFATAADTAASTADRARANHTGAQAQSTVTGLVADLALKANLLSPIFSGDPTAPTPTTGDRDDSIATTSFVGNETDLVRGGFMVKPMVDIGTVQPLPPFTAAGPVLTATGNGDLDATFGADPESFPYDSTMPGWLDGNLARPFQATAVALDSSGSVYACGRRVDSNGNLSTFGVVKWTNGLWALEFGTTGSGNGQFDGPQGIAVASGGDIFVSDTNNHRIQRFNSSGGYQSQFGTFGSGNGQFSSPFGIALDSSGNIFVVDAGNHRIQRFNSSGVYQSQFGTNGSGNGQFSLPRGIALDSSGNIFVADQGNHRIQRFNSSGVYQSQFGTLGSGNGQFNFPRGVALDSSGNIFVADTHNHRIQKFNSSGGYQSQFGTFGSGNGQFSFPFGIVVDSSSNVYVADFTNRRTQKFAYVNTSPVINGRGALVANQGSPNVHNGLYTITNRGSASTQWVLTRRNDADGSGELRVGTMVSVGLRGKQPGGLWLLSSAPNGSGGNIDPIVPGTTAITWEPYLTRPTNHGSSHAPGGDDPLPALARAVVVCSANLVTGTTEADVAGLSYTTPSAGDWIVTLSLDILCTTAGGVAIGALMVDGVNRTEQIVYVASGVGDRASNSKTWLITGLATGRVIKARGVSFGGGYTIMVTHSNMVIQRVG